MSKSSTTPPAPAEIAASTSFGSSAADSGDRPKASARWAAVLSLLLPGLGHIYAGHTLRATPFLAMPLVCAIAVAVSMCAGGKGFLPVLVTGVLGAVCVPLCALIDSVRTVRRRSEPRATIRTTILSAALILAGLEANRLIVRSFLLEAYKIPSASMVPTLLVGDHVFVDRLRAPNRGDLLVFPMPEHPEQEFVKRVVGLPGERVEFRGGHTIINGVEVPSCYLGVASYEDIEGRLRHRGKVYLETLGDRPHLTFYEQDTSFPTEQGPYFVKEGEVFVIGDNFANSHDSRMWGHGRGGGVPLKTVLGVPFTVWLSADSLGADWSRTGLDLDWPHLPPAMSDLEPGLRACLNARTATASTSGTEAESASSSIHGSVDGKARRNGGGVSPGDS